MSEGTALPTAPQPLPQWLNSFIQVVPARP